VLQCVAVCCGVLQCVAVCCSVLQGVAVCCSVLRCYLPVKSCMTYHILLLQCVAVCCSLLQRFAVYLLQCAAVCCSHSQVRSHTWPCHITHVMRNILCTRRVPIFLLPATAAICGKALAQFFQHTATHHNTLQHTTTYCSTRGRRLCVIHSNTLQHSVLRAYTSVTYHRCYLRQGAGTHSATLYNTLQHTATHYNILQHTWEALVCHTLQNTATHCNTLQHNATQCNTRCNCHLPPLLFAARRWRAFLPGMEIDWSKIGSCSHTNESYHTHETVMSHTWMSHVTHMNESCHTHEWVMSRTWMNQVTRTRYRVAEMYRMP